MKINAGDFSTTWQKPFALHLRKSWRVWCPWSYECPKGFRVKFCGPDKSDSTVWVCALNGSCIRFPNSSMKPCCEKDAGAGVWVLETKPSGADCLAHESALALRRHGDAVKVDSRGADLAPRFLILAPLLLCDPFCFLPCLKQQETLSAPPSWPSKPSQSWSQNTINLYSL